MDSLYYVETDREEPSNTFGNSAKTPSTRKQTWCLFACSWRALHDGRPVSPRRGNRIELTAATGTGH
jgi:hypothetical protein